MVTIAFIELMLKQNLDFTKSEFGFLTYYHIGI